MDRAVGWVEERDPPARMGGMLSRRSRVSMLRALRRAHAYAAARRRHVTQNWAYPARSTTRGLSLALTPIFSPLSHKSTGAAI